jgi:hypothetical protein
LQKKVTFWNKKKKISFENFFKPWEDETAKREKDASVGSLRQ